jgi:hypothetical protein
MSSYIDYDNDDADQQPIDWGDLEEMQERADEIRHAEMYDPQPEGDFSGSSEDEEWGGR